MNNPFDTIQDFLDNNLSDSERNQFLNAMRENPELLKEVEFQKKLQEIITHQIATEEGENAIKMVIAETDNNYFNPPKVSLSRWRKWIAPVAAAASLIGIVVIWQLQEPDIPFPSMPQSIQRDNTGNLQENAAAKAFNKGEYQTSIQLLHKLTQNDSITVRYRYFLGLSYLGANQFKEAIGLLEPISKDSSLYATDANYYMAVSLVKLRQYESAILYAKKVTEKSAFYPQAKAIIKKYSSN